VKQYVLAVILLAGCASGLLLYQQPTKALGAPEAAKQKWEYKKETHLDEAGMNKLGAQGWELVSVSSDRDGNNKYYLFKRPK